MVLVLLAIAGAVALLFGPAAPAHAASNGLFNFAITSSSVTEGGTATITVHRSCTGSCIGLQNVEYELTAGSGSLTTADFVSPFSFGDNKFVTFEGGVEDRDISIRTYDDDDAEGSETLTITLLGVTGGGDLAGTKLVHTLAINDNDGPPHFSFSQSNHNVNEGNVNFTVIVNRSGGAGQAVEVDYATVSGGSADAPADYTSKSGTLNFTSSQTSRTFTVTIKDDSANEGNETIRLRLSSPSDGGSVGDEATITIVDDDGTATYAFASPNYSVVESQGPALLRVVRSGGTGSSIVLQCSVIGGDASTPSDYPSAQVQVSFSSGETEDDCVFPITNNAIAEATKTVLFQLSKVSGTGNVSGQSTATLNILDDDGSGTFYFEQSAYSVAEAAGSVTLTVRRNNISGSASVDYATAIGSAGPEDFTQKSGTLHFTNGQATATVTISITNDAIAEVDQKFTVALSNPSSGATLGTPNVATVTILDDEFGVPTVTGLSPNAGPPGGGNTVDISGTSFVAGCEVYFGGVEAPLVTIINQNMMRVANIPAHTIGKVDVIVSCFEGTSQNTSADDYTYTAGPIVFDITPDTGPAAGGTIVAISGQNFANVTSVKIGTAEVQQWTVRSTSNGTLITGVTPPQPAGTYNVTVTTTAGTSPVNAEATFTYTGATTLPVISSITPNSVAINTSGTTATITGTNFAGVTAVTFGGASANIVSSTETSIIVTVPSRSVAGAVRVIVTTTAGASPDNANDSFTYTSGQAPVYTYTLYPRWTLITWNGPTKNAMDAIKGQESPADSRTNDISGRVSAIFYWNAAGTGCPAGQSQCWFAFFPSGVGIPGANDFSSLVTGQIYWVSIDGSGSQTWTIIRD